MNIDEKEIEEIQNWRIANHLVVDREKWAGAIEFKRAEPKNFHFFNYDPTLGPTDLSNVSVKKDTNRDSAVFSIPLSFTESARSRYKSHNDMSKGLDIQAYLTPFNAPVFPQKR